MLDTYIFKMLILKIKLKENVYSFSRLDKLSENFSYLGIFVRKTFENLAEGCSLLIQIQFKLESSKCNQCLDLDAAQTF